MPVEHWHHEGTGVSFTTGDDVEYKVGRAPAPIKGKWLKFDNGFHTVASNGGIKRVKHVTPLVK